MRYKDTLYLLKACSYLPPQTAPAVIPCTGHVDRELFSSNKQLVQGGFPQFVIHAFHHMCVLCSCCYYWASLSGCGHTLSTLGEWSHLRKNRLNSEFSQSPSPDFSNDVKESSFIHQARRLQCNFTCRFSFCPVCWASAISSYSIWSSWVLVQFIWGDWTPWALLWA